MLHAAALLVTMLAPPAATPPAPAAPATPAAPAAPAKTDAPAKPAAAAPKAPAADETGFVALFNGRDLSGWQGDTTGYLVENGAIWCGPKGTNLYTAGEYGNFVLRFEFQLTPGANNGIGVRAPLQGDAAYEGMEIQVLDDGHAMYKGKIAPWQHHGSVYGIAASHGSTAALRPTGEWNTEEIVVDGRDVVVTLNGVEINRANLDEATRNGTLSKHKHPGLARTSGHIGFLGHGDRVGYRNIRVKPLPEPKPAPAAKPATGAAAPTAPATKDAGAR
ncbi:MAG: DUF1080 domain-containing protein [Phycisphaerales bacterium]